MEQIEAEIRSLQVETAVELRNARTAAIKQIEAEIKSLKIEYKKKDKKQPKAIDNTLVIDQHEGFYLTHLDEPMGRQWRYGDLWVYVVLKNRITVPPKNAGEAPAVIESLVPIELPKKLGVLPDKLYRALFWKEGDILFSLRNTLLDKLNTFSTYVLIGILLFFIYLMYNSL